MPGIYSWEAHGRGRAGTIPGGTISAISDMGGWTVHTPKPSDTGTYSLTDFTNQPGSRIYYVDWSSGVDASADYYFLNSTGTAIIDSSGSPTGAGGVAYGTDPLNPTGPVKPYKHFSWVGPHRGGQGLNTADTSDGGGDQIGSNFYTPSVGRHGKPDWWLFKRGVVHDLKTDLADRRGGVTTGTLSFPGGESTTHPSVCGAWGSELLSRPVIKSGGTGGFVSRFADVGGGNRVHSHMHYVSLTFDGHLRSAGDAYTVDFYYHDATCTNILFEDCMFDATSGSHWSLTNGGDIKFNRCVALYTYKDSTVSWLYTEKDATAALTVNQCILALNAYRNDPEPHPVIFTAALSAAVSGTLASNWAYNTETYMVLFSDGSRRSCSFTANATNVTWSGAVTASANATTAPPVNSVFDRTVYLSHGLDCINSELTENVILCGGSGEQIRAGAVVERNYFVGGGFTMSGNGGNALANTGTVKNNVQQLWMDLTGSNANPGYGIGLANGAHDVDVSGNLVTNQGLTADEKTTVNASGWGAYSIGGTIPSWFASQINPTTANVYANNIAVQEGYTAAHIKATNGSDDNSQPDWVVSNTVTATGANLNGAVSCTLTAGWPGVTGSYTLTFSDTSTRVATLTHGNTAVSWTGALGTCTTTITTPAYATWTLNGAQYTQFPDMASNTFASTNTYVGGSTKTSYTKLYGATAPMPELSDTNTYNSGGGSIYASIAAFSSGVPSAIDPTRTLKSYLLSELAFAFPSITSKEGGQEFAAFAKQYLRKNTVGGGVYGYDERFLGRKIRNWVVAGSGMEPV